MGANLPLYGFGKDGVNLVKNPLQLGDYEATQLQNAELVLDEGKGGEGALSKRGGLAALTSALAGSVLGMVGLPLQTTYTKTIYAALMTQDSDTFRTSTNGTTWATTTSPLVAAITTKLSTQDSFYNARRHVGFRNVMLYPGNDYTVGSSLPPLNFWKGSEGGELVRIPIGPSAGGALYPNGIADMLVADGRVFLTVYDPNDVTQSRGRVMVLNLTTGQMSQVASAFGAGTGETTGGHPACMVWYQGQLWVGLWQNSGSTNAGTIVRANPDTDTTWTTDVSNLAGNPLSMAEFNGDLYIGVQGSGIGSSGIYKRTSSSATYAQVESTGAAGTDNGVFSMIKYDGAIYGVKYHSTGPVIHVLRSTDGTTWVVDRDVDALDSGVTGNVPTNSIIFGNTLTTPGDLYFSFRATAVGAGDGFIMRRSAGAWSKVVTDNFQGGLNVLTERA